MTETLQLVPRTPNQSNEYPGKTHPIEDHMTEKFWNSAKPAEPQADNSGNTYFKDNDLEEMGLPNPKNRQPIHTPVVIPRELIKNYQVHDSVNQRKAA